MQQETIQLEKLRQLIEDAEYEAGSQSDYLDYGKPNEAQKKKAQQSIEQLMSQSQRLKLQLQQTIAVTRKNKPDAFDEWVKVHRQMLERIMAEQATDTKSRVRQSTARGTLNQWEKVLAGEQEYVGINWHYLKDYKANVRKVFGKRWWEFWK